MGVNAARFGADGADFAAALTRNRRQAASRCQRGKEREAVRHAARRRTQAKSLPELAKKIG